MIGSPVAVYLFWRLVAVTWWLKDFVRLAAELGGLVDNLHKVAEWLSRGGR